MPRNARLDIWEGSHKRSRTGNRGVRGKLRHVNDVVCAEVDRISVTAVCLFARLGYPQRLSISRPEISLPELPAEVIAVVGQMLAQERLHGTLASLNRTSKSIRYQTTPTLMHTVWGRRPKGTDHSHSMSIGDFDNLIKQQFFEPYRHIRSVASARRSTRLTASESLRQVRYDAVEYDQAD
jgi:hypothetical protein